MTLTQELAALALATPAARIAPADYKAAKILLLDALGCALAGRDADGCEAAARQMRDWGGKPEAEVLFHGDRLPAPHAAFVNSVRIHALDLDDIYAPGTLHISSIVVPAMLAGAEMADASGREALEALILGVEVAARIEIPGVAHRRGMGFLPTSLAGSFGGVAVAARLRGLSEEQCVNALGMNYAQLAGNRQALLDSTLSKRLQPAFAARSALWSTALAQHGLTGPPQALEGDAGYYRLYLDMPDPPPPGSFITPPDAWQIRRVSYKRYPSCGACHAVQDATEQLIARDRLEPQDIARVQIFGRTAGDLVSRPFVIGPTPQVDAQFSVAWAVAHTLLRGPAKIEDYRSERVASDDAVIDLAQAITYGDPPEGLPPVPPGDSRWQGVIVDTTDGRRLIGYQGHVQVTQPGNLSVDKAIDKFQQCAAASSICSPAQARRVIDEVIDLDQADNIQPLLASLRPTPAPAA